MNEPGSGPAAMLLCAGLGTRLRPLSDELAKPMVPVGDRPAIAQVLARVRLARPARVVVNVHHLPDDVRAWAEGEGVDVSPEPELLGTAGGVARARALLGPGDVLLWNGDIASELEPRGLVAAHAAPHQATLAVRPRARGEGNVGLDARGRIVRLRGESFGDEARGGEFLGIHVLGAALRERLPNVGCLVGDVYLPALARGEHLAAYLTDAPFLDVGTVAAYLSANAAWLASRGVRAWAHPTATVRASVDGSVVGRGAVVDADATASVVWPGAHVRTPCHRAVITPASIVAGVAGTR
jgi:mannose-1-phosphate guanylyltransferase